MSADDKAQSDGKKSDEAVRAIVAKGRTVSIPGKKFGPGDTVRLPKAEADRLRGLGYLVDETAAALPVGNGPTFGTQDGPTVNKVA